MVNIGGFLAVNDHAVYEDAANLAVIYEGLHTYGGMAGRDMEALATGIEESLHEDHIRARVGQVLYLGQKLIDAGVPIVQPIGGHGVFLDAKAFLPHIPQEQYPAQALAAALYLDSGVQFDGAGHCFGGPEQGDGREQQAKAGTGAADDSAAGVYAGAHGRGGGIGGGGVIGAGGHRRVADDLRAEISAVLPGAV